ncbi:MAG: methylamine utilization protein [Burkholderiaceae bacterium]
MTASRWLTIVATFAWPLSAATAPVTVAVFSAGDRPLVDAVVFLESREARASARPQTDVAIAQEHRRFIPMVSVVPVGTRVFFPNRDKVRHHVYSFSPIKPFEIKLYAGTPAEPVVFDKPGIAVLGCNIHDDMIAWIVVVETPYFGRTGADGRVTLAQVPPGAYRLRAWHPDQPAGSPVSDEALQVGAATVAADVRLGAVAR